MKKVIIAAALSLLLVAPVMAADNATKSKSSNVSIEQHKSKILTRIDKRIALSQEEKTCIKAAKTPEEFKACQENFNTAYRAILDQK